MESVAHEGFNWKQQSLLACILFSSRVQRTPIISFLLYCLFSSPPAVAGLLAKSPEPATELPFPSFRSPGFDCPPPTNSLLGAAFPSSFQRFVSRTFPKRPRFPSSSRLPRYPPALPPRLTAHSPCKLTGYSTEFLRSSTMEGKNVRLRMKDETPRWKVFGASSISKTTSFCRTFALLGIWSINVGKVVTSKQDQR